MDIQHVEVSSKDQVDALKGRYRCFGQEILQEKRPGETSTRRIEYAPSVGKTESDNIARRPAVIRPELRIGIEITSQNNGNGGSAHESQKLRGLRELRLLRIRQAGH